MLKPHIPVDHGYLCLAYPFYIHNFLSRFQSGYKRVLVDDHSNIIRVQSNVCTRATAVTCFRSQVLVESVRAGAKSRQSGFLALS